MMITDFRSETGWFVYQIFQVEVFIRTSRFLLLVGRFVFPMSLALSYGQNRSPRCFDRLSMKYQFLTDAKANSFESLDEQFQ